MAFKEVFEFTNLSFSGRRVGKTGRQEAPFTLGSLRQHLCSKHLSVTNGFPDEMGEKERCSETKVDKPEHQWRVIMKSNDSSNSNPEAVLLLLCFPIAASPRTFPFSSSIIERALQS